jgi:hypothetical protein
VGTSFPFPHLSPINAHPQAPFESNPNSTDFRLLHAPFEVSDNRSLLQGDGTCRELAARGGGAQI